MLNVGDTVRMTWFARFARVEENIRHLIRPGMEGTVMDVWEHRLGSRTSHTYRVSLGKGRWLDGVSQYILFILPLLRRVKGRR